MDLKETGKGEEILGTLLLAKLISLVLQIFLLCLVYLRTDMVLE